MKKTTKRFMSACAAVALAAVMAFGGIGTSVAQAAQPTYDFEEYVDVEAAKKAIEDAKIQVENQIAYVEENYEAMYKQAYAELADAGYIAIAQAALELAKGAVAAYEIPVEVEAAITEDGRADFEVLEEEFVCAKEDAVEAIDKVIIVLGEADTLEEAMAAAETLLPEALCAYEHLMVVAEEVSPVVAADLQALYDEYAPQVKAAIDEFIIAAEAKLAEVEAAVKAEIEKQLKALEEAIKELEAAIKAEIKAIEAELQAKLAELEAQLKEAEAAVKAEIEAAIEAVETILAELDTTIAEVEAAIEEAIVAIETAVNDIDGTIAKLEAELEAAYAEAMAAIEAAYISAITGEYVVDSQSYYLALGDSILLGEDTYADKLAAELTETYGLPSAGKTALDGFRAEDFRYLLDETYALDAYGVNETKEQADEVRDAVVAQIEAADLITITFGNDNFTSFVAAQANGANYEMDWARFVTEEGVPYVKEALAEASAEVAAEAPAMVAEAVDDMLEAYAYSFVGFAANYTAVLDEIHAINPEAEVVVTGLYNSIDGLTVEGVNIGEYVDYFIELSNQMFIIYSMITPNITFVAIEDTEATMDGKNPGTFAYLAALMGAKEGLLPTEAGHAYIADQIFAAEDISVAGLKGDVNLDGVVDDADVNLLYRYVNKYTELTALQIENGNVNNDEIVDDADVNLLYRYVNHYVAEL